MQEIVLEAEKRTIATKGALQVLRKQGRIPAVAYGDGDPMPLSLNEKSLQLALHSERGRNALMTLNVSGSTHPILVKEIQRDILTRKIIHVDLHRVSLKQKIEVLIPVHVKGEAPGVKLSGGILEHIIRDVRVKCLPTDIPPFLDVDVSSLQLNQGIKAKELHLPANVELLIDAESMIVNIVSVHVEETPAPGTAAVATTGAEPEVIKKGKTDEATAEGAAAAKPGAAGAKPAAAGAKPAAAPAKPETKK